MIYLQHKNMKDVCFEVLEAAIDNNLLTIKGCWINIAMGKPFHIGNRGGLAIETLTIPEETYKQEWVKSSKPPKFKKG